MTSVARFEEGCECEAKMASRQPAGRRRYTGATPALGRAAGATRLLRRRQSNNFRML